MKKGKVNKKKSKKQRSIELPVLNTSSNGKSKIRDSKTSRWRALVLITITVLMIAHVIQWIIMGSTVTPIEPSESMHTLETGAVNAGFIFFSLAILATLIFGRFVCGWGCHIVALQDFCAWLLKKINLKPKPFRSRLLIFVPLIVALYMFVYPTAIRYLVKPPEQPLIPEFTNHIITTEFWATFPPIAVAIPFLFICGFMTVYFLGQKGFCTYACPYGGFFSIADKFAPGKIRVTDDCEHCGHCTASCTSNVLVHKEVAEYGMVVDQGCMKCMDCISVCPNDALYFGFGKPALGVSKTIKKTYSLTLAEDIAAAFVFAFSYFAVWDVYQLVPMLMALGIATVTTFLTFKTWRLFIKKQQTFYRYSLKSDGKFKTAGLIFISLATLWIGLNIHSGFVNYHETKGANIFTNIQIPDELALAQSNPKQWITPNIKTNIDDGIYHFKTASSYGFFTNKQAISKVAWLEYLAGNTEESLNLLQEAADNQKTEGKALSFYYRGSILNRLGRYEKAIIDLDKALAERPDLVLAREEKGVSLWNLKRRDEATSVWKEAVKQNPRLPLSNNFLSGAARFSGNAADAKTYERLADQLTPNDPLFHWVLGVRLKDVNMKILSDKHINRAIQLNPTFKKYRQ